MTPTHLERCARQLKGAANSCTRAKARDCLTDQLRYRATILRRRILALLDEAVRLEEAARLNRVSRREANAEASARRGAA